MLRVTGTVDREVSTEIKTHFPYRLHRLCLLVKASISFTSMPNGLGPQLAKAKPEYFAIKDEVNQVWFEVFHCVSKIYTRRIVGERRSRTGTWNIRKLPRGEFTQSQ